MKKKILFFLKEYGNYSDIFNEYANLFRENGFETKIFDFTQVYSSKNRLGYVASIFKEIKDFNPGSVYIGDELFSKNVFLVVFLKRFFFKDYKILALVASQYLPKNNFLNKIKLSFLLSNIDVLFCRNKAELKKIKESNLLKNYSHFFQLYLGVPAKFFYKINQSKKSICDNLPALKNKYPKIEGKYVLGYVSRIAPEKGLAALLECLKRLPDNFILILAGKKDDIDYEKEVKSFIGNNNLERRVIFIKDIRAEEVVYIYNVADLIIMPTTGKHNNFSELFGSVIAESMLCQSLVIGSDNGSIPEIMGRDDMIFKEENLDDFLRTINYVYNLSPAERIKIIEDNYNLALKEYSAEAFVGSIIRAISQ